MSCATNWPTNGQPAATVASSPPASSASLAVAGAAGRADHVQQRLVGGERRQVGEHAPVAAAVDRRVDDPVGREAVVAGEDGLGANRRHGRRSGNYSPSASRVASASGQPGLADLALRLLDVVRHAPEVGVPRLEVDQQVRRARVAVAGLADRARVEQPAAARQLELAAAASRARRRARRRSRAGARSGCGCGRRARARRVVRSSAARTADSSRMYSQTGSRGLRVEELRRRRARPSARATARNSRASSARARRPSSARSPRRRARTSSGRPRPIAARSWFPIRQTSERSRASSTQRFGCGP